MLQTSSCLGFLRVFLFVLVTALAPGAARADGIGALKQAWSCAKAAANGYITANIELAKKAEAVTEAAAQGSLCLAVQGGNAAPYAIALGALSAIKISSPASLPNGQCFSQVKQTLARPIAIGLAAAVPFEPIKQSLVELAESDTSADALWEALNASPAGPYVVQLECACTAIEAGVTLADLSAITGAIRAASQQCGSFLDEAGLGFLNDAGEAVLDGVTQFGEDGYAEAASAYEKYVLGEEEREPDEIVYQRYFGWLVYWFAAQQAVLPNWTYLKAAGPGAVGYEETWDDCFDYFDHHKVSKDGSKKTCDAFGARFLGEVSAQAGKLKEIAALRTAVFPFLSKQIAADWTFRLPLRPGVVIGTPSDAELVASYREWTTNEAMGGPYADVLGTTGTTTVEEPWIYLDATGVTKAAREAMVTIADDKEQAIDIGYAGIRPQLSTEVNLAWANAAKDVFRYYLSKLSPAEPFMGQYNCPGGELEAACVKRLNYKFGAVETCYPGIYLAHAEAPDKATMQTWLGDREAACAAALRDVTERAKWLADYELIDPVSDADDYCEFAGKDRKARGECRQALVDAANTCMAAGIEKGSGDQKILDCYEQAAGNIRLAGMDDAIDVNEDPDIDEPVGSDDLPNLDDVQLPDQQRDGGGRPQRRIIEEVEPEPEPIEEPVIRPRREDVCPTELKRGETLPEGCPRPKRR